MTRKDKYARHCKRIATYYVIISLWSFMFVYIDIVEF